MEEKKSNDGAYFRLSASAKILDWKNLNLNDRSKATILKFTSVMIDDNMFYFMFTASEDTGVFVYDHEFNRIEHKFEGIFLSNIANTSFRDHIFAID